MFLLLKLFKKIYNFSHIVIFSSYGRPVQDIKCFLFKIPDVGSHVPCVY